MACPVAEHLEFSTIGKTQTEICRLDPFWFCKLTSALEKICTLQLVRMSDISLSLVALTLVPEVFFSLGATELSGEAAIASREAARKKPLVPTDNNLTSMPTPISFDWHPQSELILETQQTRFTHARGVKYATVTLQGHPTRI